MNLKTYLAEHKQVDLARKLGVTQGAVHQWATGMTRPSAERCIQIEKATAGAVRCEDLRPDVDWAYLRGKAVIVMAAGSVIESKVLTQEP